ncbi:MAG: DegT/DnrJ/EryC1/StrS family aminotransferase [Coprobacillus cateniformis]
MDGGALFTDEYEYYQLLISLRVHGKGTFKYDNVRIGMNSRLDTIQAAILLPKLHAFKNYELDKRNEYAELYTEYLKGYVIIPYVPERYISSWAQYTILLNSENERDYLQEELKKKSIPTMIYYPTPLHKQTVYSKYNFNLDDLKNCEKVSKICLSLPMHPYLDNETVKNVTNNLISILEEYRKNG